MEATRTLLERQPPSQRPREADLVIRAMRQSDAEGLNALQNLPGFRFGTLRLPYQSVEDARKFIERQAAGHLGIVALVEDRIVGSAGLERLTGRRSHAGYLGMGVHDDYTRRGIGTALLRAVLDTADNWMNLTRLELTVFVDNAPAIALYERHGFETEGTLRAYAFRDGAFVDAYAMARIRP
jgi:putative acetyltransferase